MKNTAVVTGGKPIAVSSQSISAVRFYDIHGRKGKVPFFCSVPDTTRDIVTPTIISSGNIYTAPSTPKLSKACIMETRQRI
jgi:hypothetical protein